MPRPIRLVTFDALYTLVAPRLPIHIQYAQTFEPYLGALDPLSIQQSFKAAFQSLERSKPMFLNGSQTTWWSEVIRRTALGAGANEKVLEVHRSAITRQLFLRFSSKEGYKAFDDAIPTLESLRHRLKVGTAIVSNADYRMRLVLQDLGFPDMKCVVLSEEEGIEKPSPELFLRAITLANAGGVYPEITPEECLHVGDELVADYEGALAAGMKALLLQRSGQNQQAAHRNLQEASKEVHTIDTLYAVEPWINTSNSRQ